MVNKFLLFFLLFAKNSYFFLLFWPLLPLDTLEVTCESIDGLFLQKVVAHWMRFAATHRIKVPVVHTLNFTKKICKQNCIDWWHGGRLTCFGVHDQIAHSIWCERAFMVHTWIFQGSAFLMFVKAESAEKLLKEENVKFPGSENDLIKMTR